MIRSLRCPSSNVNNTFLTYDKDLCYTRSCCEDFCQGTLSCLTNSSFSLNSLPLRLRLNIELNGSLIQYVSQKIYVCVSLSFLKYQDITFFICSKDWGHIGWKIHIGNWPKTGVLNKAFQSKLSNIEI